MDRIMLYFIYESGLFGLLTLWGLLLLVPIITVFLIKAMDRKALKNELLSASNSDRLQIILYITIVGALNLAAFGLIWRYRLIMLERTLVQASLFFKIVAVCLIALPISFVGKEMRIWFISIKNNIQGVRRKRAARNSVLGLVVIISAGIGLLNSIYFSLIGYYFALVFIAMIIGIAGYFLIPEELS
jgi:hypothetical protein